MGSDSILYVDQLILYELFDFRLFRGKKACQSTIVTVSLTTPTKAGSHRGEGILRTILSDVVSGFMMGR
jgi:hypothetical protein